MNGLRFKEQSVGVLCAY